MAAMIRLTEAELTCLLRFMDELQEKFSTDGCNDYQLENTRENRDLFNAVEKFASESDKGREVRRVEDCSWGKKLFTNNTTVLRYLIARLESLSQEMRSEETR